MAGTAEIILNSLHSDEVLNEKDLPIKYAGYSPCFRKEAGAAGRDTRGIVRIHQFNKVEQYIYCTPEQSDEMHEHLLNNLCEVMEDLELPYRVIEACTGKDKLQPTTEISRLKITTTSVSDYTLHFDFNVEVDGPNVTIDIKPQGYDGYYYYGVFWAKDVAGATEEQLRGYCEADWENNKAYYSAFFDTTEEGLHFIFNELAFRGEQHLEVELDANTEFILWAFGMDDEALMNTTPEFHSFKTGNVKASENTFVLSVTELYPRKATVKVETSNDDSYIAALVAGDRFEGNTDAEIMEYILTNFSVQYVNGTMSDTATGLVPSTEYELLVFGAQAGAALR